MDHNAVAGLSALREIYGDLPPTRFYDHHRAHAAAAYFTSGLDRAAIAALDGYGQLCSSVAWLGEGTRISRVRAEPFYNSLGTQRDAFCEQAARSRRSCLTGLD